jgi:hypothetical protein
MVLDFGNAPISQLAKGLEIVWVDQSLIEIESFPTLNQKLSRIEQLIDLGGIETKCQPNQRSSRNLIG